MNAQALQALAVVIFIVLILAAVLFLPTLAIDR